MSNRKVLDMTRSLDDLFHFVKSTDLEELSRLIDTTYNDLVVSRAVLDCIAVGIVVANSDHEIVIANSKALGVLKTTSDELIGKSISHFLSVHQIDAMNWMAQLNPSSKSDRQLNVDPFVSELVIDGSPLAVEIRPVVDENTLLGLGLIITDGAVERTRDRLTAESLSTLFHELRTPMSSMKGYVDLLLLGAAGEVTADQRRILEVMKSGADRLSMLLNTLLEMIHLEAGVKLEIQDVSAKEIITDVVDEFNAVKERENRDIQIIVKLEDDVPMIKADRERIYEILTILVRNAYQYTLDGGTVTVSALSEAGGIKIIVADTGVGIPEEDKPFLFSRHTRGTHPMVMRISGIGNGLYIAQTLAQLHQGHISVLSEIDKGSTFEVWLPLDRAGGKKQTSNASPTKKRRGVDAT